MPLLLTFPSTAVARITLNRPERSNALSPELLEALSEALARLKARLDIRIVLLAAEGKNFCGGLDLTLASESDEKAKAMSMAVVQCLTALRNLPQMVIAVVQGAARAGGGALMVASDIVVAEETCNIAFPEIHRGLDPILLFPLLRRRLSSSALSELILTGQVVDVHRAKELGLVHRVVSAGQGLTQAENLAAGICRSASGPLRTAKELILAQETTAAGYTLEQEFAQTVESHLISWQSAAAREGVAAFLEKRLPGF